MVDRRDRLGDVERLGVGGRDGRDEADARAARREPGRDERGVEPAAHGPVAARLEGERVVERDEVEQTALGGGDELDEALGVEQALGLGAHGPPGGGVRTGVGEVDAQVDGAGGAGVGHREDPFWDRRRPHAQGAAGCQGVGRGWAGSPRRGAAGRGRGGRREARQGVRAGARGVRSGASSATTGDARGGADRTGDDGRTADRTGARRRVRGAHRGARLSPVHRPSPSCPSPGRRVVAPHRAGRASRDLVLTRGTPPRGRVAVRRAGAWRRSS